MRDAASFTERKHRPKWGTLLLVGLLHVAVLAGLVRAFAPDLPRAVAEQAASLVTVTVFTPPPPPPEPRADPAPHEGAAGEQGRRATPREVTAPPVPRPVTLPAPRVRSTGTANTSGAAERGQGSGAGGEGEGTGSGRSGSGTGGGVPAAPPVKIAGNIDDSDIDDFPVPPGGRESRIGQSVIVAMTVGTDGRATNCRVAKPSNDPAADRLVCQLAVERFRFRPATDANGNPVPATYGWRQDFFRRE
ncbi:TonB family protein [Altererythrobacter soli]|uniref:TonB family protein n=1 Tax=Croceibacterium soli TaxID=1739690 RepID=A0A6I4UTG5_9SPHN|nr:TonB family protein [Croceibacterium soli]